MDSNIKIEPIIIKTLKTTPYLSIYLLKMSEDSFDVVVEKPKEEQDKIKSAFEWEIKQDSTDEKANLHLAFNVIYLKRLMEKTPEFKQVPKQVRQFVRTDCIFYTPFDIAKQGLKGNVQFIYSRFTGLTIKIKFVNESIPYNTGWCKIHYQDSAEWKSRGIRIERLSKPKQNSVSYGITTRKQKSQDVQYSNEFQASITYTQLVSYTKNYFLLHLQFYTTHKSYECDFMGIENIGNTCYFNSLIQVLYFIRPFRKMIMENQPKNALLESLQDLFFQLSSKQILKRAADPINVMRCFPHYEQHNPQQQDVQQFMITFFQELQKQIPEVRYFWEGQGQYILQAKDPNITYKSIQEDIFYQLDLHIDDHKGNRFATIIESLNYLLAEQKVDELIETEKHGKIEVTKKRIIKQLPSVMFFNLKRYSYDFKRHTLSKILDEMKYPATINLGFLLGTPSGNDDSDYSLFAFTVHEGRSPNRGHYYSFINTSDSLASPAWYKFNDSIVEPVQLEKILKKYQGQKQQVIEINKQYGRWESKQYNSEQTAYMLVYLRNSCFQQFQEVKTRVPAQFLQKHRGKVKEKDQQETITLRVHVMKEEDDFNPFANCLEYLDIPLNRQEDLMAQLISIQDSFLGTTIGTVWKVNNVKATVKYCGKKYGPKFALTPDRLGTYRTGHDLPDYLLIIPKEQSQKHIQNLQSANELVLLQIDYPKGRKFEVIHRLEMDSFISTLSQTSQGIATIEDANNTFKRKWNDFCTVKIQ